MKVTCNVIKDLLPLYYDNFCSEDTKRIVEEHLSTCESCRKELSYLSGEFTFNANINEEKIRNNASNAVKKMRKTNLFLGFCAAVCLLGIVFILGLLVAPSLKRDTTTVDNAEYKYTLTAGLYEVGVDIPAGTYKAHIVEKDKGYFTLYKSLDGSLMPLNTYRVDKNEKSNNDKIEKVNNGNRQYRLFLVKSKVRDVTLESGQFVEIHFDATIVFYSNEVQNAD